MEPATESRASARSRKVGGVRNLVRALDLAVQAPDVEAITGNVSRTLIAAFRDGSFPLPRRFHRTSIDRYARRLLHRDPERGYSVVVMTWGPGQGTPLHDHAGKWCVEGVVHGRVRVRRFDLLERSDDLYRFREAEILSSAVGSAGALIPPLEYHVVENEFEDRHSITVHVYGGDMDACSIFERDASGWYRCRRKTLAFDA